MIVWQKSMELTNIVYKLTSTFPENERYGLTSQIRRSAVSIPSNIAEGYGRQSTKDYTRFLQIARGSLYELQTELEISKNLNFLEKYNFEKTYKVTREIEAMLQSLITKLKNKL